MKQVLLDPRTGAVSVAETPAPSSAPDRLLVRTDVSVISPGTERQLIALSSRGLVGKARARPEAVRQVIETVRREGARSAAWKARARLDHPFPLGYSLAGTVLEVGSELDGPVPGTRVACAGAEVATHSEVVSVPPLLAVPVPGDVSQEEAAFASIGAIALHAVRLSGVEAGGTAVVLGLGLLGQLSAQILASTGAWTLAVDPAPDRRELAGRLAGAVVSAGGEDAASACGSRGGADAVLVTAASAGPEVLEEAVALCRDRGTIVVVGSVPIQVDRDAMYRKELTLVVARSSGAGRYDPVYEDRGIDMPVGHVRWTEGRNMAAFLDLVRQGKLSLPGLVTHRFGIDAAEEAYRLLDSASEPSLAILLEYRPAGQPISADVVLRHRPPSTSGRPRIGVVGAGSFGRGVLLPNLKALGVELSAVATASGSSAAGTARRFGFARATTDAASVVAGEDVDAVVIATRHDIHAALAAAALRAGRSVYVEKPLALERETLLEVCRAWAGSTGLLSVGFNRRFAPLARTLRSSLRGAGPVSASYTVSATPPAPGSWVLDRTQGGGVALAEGGHFLDTLAYLIGSLPAEVSATAIGATSYQATVRFLDGSLAGLTYTTEALGRGPKERLTVAGRGVLTHLDDFRSLKVWAGGRPRTTRIHRQDKGHRGALAAWVEAVGSGGDPPVPVVEVIALAEATICLDEAIRTGRTVPVDLHGYVEALGPATR